MSKTSTGHTFVSNSLVERVCHIIEETGAEIVLSSDWRLSEHDIELDELREKFAKYHLHFYDKTPYVNDGMDRECEVMLYLATHSEVEQFAIVDDYFVFPKLREHFVRTNDHFGITEADAQRLIDILNTPKGE